ncbi:MAG: hypothetical protein K2H41_08045 [Acetatifactor sp.]|nr:hypothetical protein [Acetatifactor sp.]
MKKTFFSILCLLGIMLSACGAGAHYYNKKANDSISTAIYQELGEDIYYQGKYVTDTDNVTVYEYLFFEEQDGQLANLLKTINAVLQQQGSKDKLAIMCFVKIPGGLASVCRLDNYSDNREGISAENPSIQNLRIWGASDIPYTIYNNPAVYSDLQDIKHLTISYDMATITERDNIDWHEYFPDLETLEIIPEEPYN